MAIKSCKGWHVNKNKENFYCKGKIADWWKEATRNTYEEKQTCITDFYGSYTVKVNKNPIRH